MKTHLIKKRTKASPVRDVDPNILPVGPRTKVHPKFIYVHYESSWLFDEEFGWIPELSKLLALPGVNGVNLDAQGMPNLQPAINGATAKGGTVIYDADKRLLRRGEDPEDALFYRYSEWADCSNGGRWWTEPGQAVSVSPSGRILWDDEAAARVFAAFRAHIRDTGIIEPMHYLVLQEKLDLQKEKVNSLRGRVGMNPHLAPDLARAEAILEAMNKPADEAADIAAAKPVRKRRSKSDG